MSSRESKQPQGMLKMLQDPHFVSDARKIIIWCYWNWLGLSFLPGPNNDPEAAGRKNLSYVLELAWGKGLATVHISGS